MSATMYHGKQFNVDYTPASAVSGGDVVSLAGTLCISPVDIAASALGAVSWPNGSAMYKMTKAAGDGLTFAAGDYVGFDISAGEAVAIDDAASDGIIGRCFEDAADDDAEVKVIHELPFDGTLDAAQQALSGAGAINVTSYYTAWTTTGAQAGTLADGKFVGQLKKIKLIVDGGDGTLTPANFANGTTITFADAGDYAILRWNGAEWRAIEVGNDADGATAPVIA